MDSFALQLLDIRLREVGAKEASKSSTWKGDKQDTTRTHGHRDYLIESAQWADSMKICLHAEMEKDKKNYTNKVCAKIILPEKVQKMWQKWILDQTV